MGMMYGFSYFLLALTAWGFHLGNASVWMGIAIIFVVLPIIEFLTPRWKIKTGTLNTKVSDVWLYISPVVLTAFLIYAGQTFLNSQSTWEQWGIVLSTGTLMGAVGISIAHELVHRKETWERALGVWNLLLVNFGHWGVEHVFGHHKSVGTPDDHATAARGQWLYSFWLQDFFGGLVNSYRFEQKRVESKTYRWLRNRIVNYQIISLVATVSLLFWDPVIALFWWGQSIMAIIMLLSVDYIEHYGLMRKKKENGLYEPVGFEHSWDTEAPLTNLTLYNLALHSHHHMKARLPYQELRAQTQCHTLPYGYAAMVALAYVPPLFIKTMDPLISETK